MKKIGSIVLTAIVASVVTSGTMLYFSNHHQNISVHHVSETPVVGATYTVNADGNFEPLDFTKVSAKVMPAVVHIKNTQMYTVNQSKQNQYNNPFNDDLLRQFFGPQFFNQRQQNIEETPAKISTGSGVIINKDGYIVTNNHVIEDADDLEVTLNDNRVFKAKVIGSDPSTDIALIQIKADNLDFIPFTNSDEVEVGEWVIAVGNPFNLNSTVTAGIVSAKARNINILHDQSAIESFIQTDAAINPGNSGGALVDLQGGLIGINTAIASPTGAYTGYGFAVPSNIVNKVVDDLMEYGMVQRGYLGLMIRNVDGNLAKEKNLDVTTGVYVAELAKESAAADAGVKVDDVIIKVDDTSVKATSELLEIIGRHRPGDKVTLTIDRFGKEKQVEVILKNQNGKAELASANSGNGMLSNLGVKIEDIDNKTAKQLGVDGGVRITDIGQGVISRQTKIHEGFIITKIDGKPVKNSDKFLEYLTNKKGGVMVEGMYEDYPGLYYYAFGIE